MIDAMAGLRAVVVGDSLLDAYLDGEAVRLCREEPVPLVELSGGCDRAGGAANTAANLAALGAEVRLVSLVGADAAGARLRRALHVAGVDDTHVVTGATRATHTAVRVRADGRLLVRVDERDRTPIDAQTARRITAALVRALDGADVVVLSDYDRGVLGETVLGQTVLGETVLDALAAWRRPERVLMVDAKHPARFRQLAPTAVKPNWAEARLLLGDGAFDGVGERAEGIARHGDRLLALTGARIAAVTLDADGAVIFERDRPPYRTFASRRSNDRAIGAGDTYTAAFALALGVGADPALAAEVAAAAAGCVLSTADTTACTAAQLRSAAAHADKLIPVDALAAALEERSPRPRVVLTAGWFDRLHRGHLTFLDRAKTRGNLLVVAVNDGPRPVGAPAGPPTADRVAVLSALSCVDHVVTFAAPTPEAVLEALVPDVFVKGGDRSPEDVPERHLAERLGVEVLFLPEMEDRGPLSRTGPSRARPAPPSRAADATPRRRTGRPTRR